MSAMATTALRTVLAEPRVPDAPRRVWRDWAVAAAIVVGSVVEALLRDDVPWPVPTLLVSVALAAAVPWRRTHPLATTVVVLGATNALSIVVRIADGRPAGYYSMAFLLVVLYSLFRWGSGRDAVVGVGLMLVAWIVGITTDPGTIGEAIGGFAVLLLTAALGLLFRARATAHRRELEDVKLREREQLARELHDTVAHHVSAIAVQAQAGRAVAPTRPEAALEALAVIEESASRTLEEMRAMVGTLRNGAEAELAPQPGVGDLRLLSRSAGRALQVDVELTGDLDDLRSSVDAAIYRIAQESITNAMRHARNASRVDVRVLGLDDCVRVTVADDGDPVPAGADQPAGFGLLGMAERAKLLGGSLQAGPGRDRGWTIVATIPRSGADR
jgi:signal transduction histidine kinase